MQTIEPPLHSHPIKTEYQLQFAWKEPVRHEIYPKVSVPVEVENAELAGDDLTKRKFRPFKSEYQLQFRDYPLVKQSPDFSIAGDKKAPANNAGDHKEGKGGTVLLKFVFLCSPMTKYNFRGPIFRKRYQIQVQIFHLAAISYI